MKVDRSGRAEVVAVVEVLVDGADQWRRARETSLQATAGRDETWLHEQRTGTSCRDGRRPLPPAPVRPARRVATVAGGRAAARGLRAPDRSRDARQVGLPGGTVTDDDVRASVLEVAAASRRVLSSGSLGVQLIGCKVADLRRLAHSMDAPAARPTRSRTDPRVEGEPMPVRDTVRDAQRRLASLDAAYTRATAKLERARTARAKAIAEQDRLVDAARLEVEQTVADMAEAIGVELTANLLGIDGAEVRRMAKPSRRTDRRASSVAERKTRKSAGDLPRPPLSRETVSQQPAVKQ